MYTSTLTIILSFTFQIYFVTQCSESTQSKSRSFTGKGFTSRRFKRGSRALQVLNQPKSFLSAKIRQQKYWNPGQYSGKTTQRPPILDFHTTNRPPILDFPTTNRRHLSPLLDFPDANQTTEAPLIDFPDPIIWSRPCAPNASKSQPEALPNQGKRRSRRAIELQNRQLLQYFVGNAIAATPIPVQQPIYGISLLDKTVDIFKSICTAKYVPVNFTLSALNLFKKLNQLTSPGRTEYLQKPDFDWILQILNDCQQKIQLPIKYFMDDCFEEILSYKTRYNWLCPPIRDNFDPSRFDPLLDIIWHIYNAVQSYCFSSFHVNYRLFHKYGMSILDLFTTPIRTRWNYSDAASEKAEFPFWDRILGPNYMVYLHNIERCTHATVLTSELKIRRPRYLFPGSVRLKYDRAPLPKSTNS